MALAPRRRRVASDDGLLVQKSFHQRNRSLDDVGGFATVLPSARRERQNHVSGRRRAIWSGGFARERPYPPTLTTSMTMAAELTLTAAAAAGSGGPALLLQRRRMYREPSRILLDQPFAELDTSLAAMQVGAQEVPTKATSIEQSPKRVERHNADRSGSSGCGCKGYRRCSSGSRCGVCTSSISLPTVLEDVESESDDHKAQVAARLCRTGPGSQAMAMLRRLRHFGIGGSGPVRRSRRPGDADVQAKLPRLAWDA